MPLPDPHVPLVPWTTEEERAIVRAQIARIRAADRDRFGGTRYQPGPGPGRAVGERHGRSKLDVARVIAIRQRYAGNDPVADIAADFGISTSQVRRIGKHVAWSHVAAEGIAA